MAIGTGAAILGGALVSGAASLIGGNAAADASKDAARMSTAEQRRQFDLVRSDTAGQRAVGNAALDRLSRLYGYGSAAPSPMSFEDWSQMNPAPPPPRGFDGLRARIEQQRNGDPRRAAYDQYVTAFQASNPATPAGAPDMGAFFESPDYQFNVEQTQLGVDRSAAARGGLLSGRAVKEGARYASNLAKGEYGSYVDRLMQQAGLGATGIGASAAAGANAANNITAANMNAGAQRGSAYQAMAGGVNSAVQGSIGNYLLSRYLQPTGV